LIRFSLDFASCQREQINRKGARAQELIELKTDTKCTQQVNLVPVSNSRNPYIFAPVAPLRFILSSHDLRINQDPCVEVLVHDPKSSQW